MFIKDILKTMQTTHFTHAKVIKNVFNIFCDSFRQKVSLEKTRVFFSKNVNNTFKDQIVDELGFQRTLDLGK